MTRTVTLQYPGCLSEGIIMHELLHALGEYVALLTESVPQHSPLINRILPRTITARSRRLHYSQL